MTRSQDLVDSAINQGCFRMNINKVAERMKAIRAAIRSILETHVAKRDECDDDSSGISRYLALKPIVWTTEFVEA